MIQNFWILLNLCCLISKECSKSVLLDSSQGRYSARSQFVLFASLENLYSSSARLLETGNHYVSQYFVVFTGIYGPICKCHLHTTPFALSPISSHSTSMLHCFFFSLGHHPQRSFTLSELSQETQISIDNPCAKSEALACLLSSVILWDHCGRTFCCFDYRNYSSSRTSRLQLCFHLCILVKSQWLFKIFSGNVHMAYDQMHIYRHYNREHFSLVLHISF